MPIETRTCSGPLKEILSRGSKAQVSSQNGCSFCLLVELDIPTPPVVKWTGHSLRRGGASTAHVVGVSIAVIMAWVLWKSLASSLLYIDVSVRPSSEALFFFGHLLSRFNHLEAPGHQQATPSVVTLPIDLSDALEALLELDD